MNGFILAKFITWIKKNEEAVSWCLIISVSIAGPAHRKVTLPNVEKHLL